MWYLLLFALVDVASAYIIGPGYCTPDAWDVNKFNVADLAEARNKCDTTSGCVGFAFIDANDDSRVGTSQVILDTDGSCVDSYDGINDYPWNRYSTSTCVFDCEIGEICTNMWGRMKSGRGFTNPVGTLMNPKRVADNVFVVGEVAGPNFKMVTFDRDFKLLDSKYISINYATSLETLSSDDYANSAIQNGSPCGDTSYPYCAGDFSCAVNDCADLSAPYSCTGKGFDYIGVGECPSASTTEIRKHQGGSLDSPNWNNYLGSKSFSTSTPWIEHKEVTHWCYNACKDAPGYSGFIVRTAAYTSTYYGRCFCETGSGATCGLAGTSYHRYDFVDITTSSIPSCTSSSTPLSQPCSYNEVCSGGGSYTLNMYDSYGDGWHGGNLIIKYTDSSGVSETLTATISGSSGSATFTGTITEMYMDFQTWASEISWNLACGGGNKQYGTTSTSTNGFRGGSSGGDVRTTCYNYPCSGGEPFLDNIPCGSSSCTSSTCPAGHIYNNGDCTEPVNCNTGEFNSNNVCQSCPAGWYQNQASQPSCKICDAGMYQDVVGQSSCKSCIAGQYQNIVGQSSCKPCGTNEESNADKTGCQCADGFEIEISYEAVNDDYACTGLYTPALNHEMKDVVRTVSSRSGTWDQVVEECYKDCTMINVDESGNGIQHDDTAWQDRDYWTNHDGSSATHFKVHMLDGTNDVGRCYCHARPPTQAECTDGGGSWSNPSGIRSYETFLIERVCELSSSCEPGEYISMSLTAVHTITGTSSDYCGGGVAMNNAGTHIAVGCARAGNPYRSGQVNIYKNDGGSWTQVGNSIQGTATEQSLGNVNSGISLSDDGTVVAIGSKCQGYSCKGIVKVYVWDGSAWNQRGGDFKGQDYSSEYHVGCGASVGLSSDGTVLAFSCTNIGMVKVFDWSGSQWNERGSGFTGKTFGMTGDGSMIAIGEIGDSTVKIYQRIGNFWMEMKIFDGNGYSSFGSSIDFSSNGEFLAIGNRYARDLDNVYQTGQVSVFQNNGGLWTLRGSDIYGDQSQQYGNTLSISDDGSTLAIGGNSYSRRFFKWSGSDWSRAGDDFTSRGNIAMNTDASLIIIGDQVSSSASLNTLGSECVDCAVGQYQDELDSLECKICSTGQYQTETSQTSCTVCDPGYYLEEVGQSSACKACESGQYQDESGQSGCEVCEVDTYQDEIGQDQCKVCVYGTEGETGRNFCNACTEGKYSEYSYEFTNLELDSTYFCESEDHTTASITTKMFYNDQDWDALTSDVRLSIGAGLANKDGVVDGNEPHYNVYGNDSPSDEYLTCYTKCKDVEGVERIAVADPGVSYISSQNRWVIKCYCLKTDGSSCNQADATTSVDYYSYASAGTGDVAVYKMIGTSSQTCIDCEVGRYQTDGLQESCESCQEGQYQDQTGQSSCKTCPSGYLYKDGVTCDFCPFSDNTHPSYNVWGSGCPPWSTNDGCFCDCGDSGFTGDNCDVCGKGMGWNGVAGQDANCTDCLYPYVNDLTTHDAVCSHDYCPPGSGTTQDQNTWSADNTTENCVQCTGITVSSDYYGQCADIVCEGQTIPKSTIDHTLDIDDQSNCEACPSDKVKHGNQCVTPECTNGVPKSTIDQTLPYNDPRNCDYCPDGTIKYGAACFAETCQAGTGTSVNEYPYVLKFTQVHNGYTVGVEGDLTLVVYESDGTRISLTLNDLTGSTVITDLAFVGDRLAVVVREFDSTKSSSQYYSGRVEFFEITTEPLGIQAEIYLESPHVISCGTHVYETAICQHIAVDGETYYLGYDTKVEEYKNDVVVATHDIRGAHVSVGGHTIAGGSMQASSTSAFIEFIHDGTKKTRMMPSWADQIKSVAVRDDGAFVAYGTYDSKLFIWDVTQSSPIEVSLSQDADVLEWLGGNVAVGHANGLDVYDTDGTHVQKLFDDTVTHLSASLKNSVFPTTVMLNVQTDSLFRQMDMECSQCVAPFVNDGSSLACIQVECSGNQSVKLTGVDVTLAFDNAINCGPCSGFNSGDPCLPIECDDASVVKPYYEIAGGLPDIINHTLAHTDQENCIPCADNQVVDDNICTNIVCDEGKEIHRVSGAYAPSDDRNCRDCTGLTVGDGKVCIDIDCGIRRIKSTVDRTLGYQNQLNCGDKCPLAHIVNQDDKTQCTACTGYTVPNKERNECIVPVCESGFKLKDVIDNSYAEDTPSYSNNCEDIPECAESGCQGSCGDMRGTYVCNDDILLGYDIGYFVNKNLHICPYGFVLSTEQPSSVSDIGDLDGKFMCPDLITYKESISYQNEIMTSSMIEVRTNGVFDSQYCSYNYNKLQHSEEDFTEGTSIADMDSGNVYIYCPSKCPYNPCEDNKVCVDHTCVDHTCEDNSQADGCYCYGSECTGYCMDNGECVDILISPTQTDLQAAFLNGVSYQV